ncbi:MAG TPA: ribonuclease PH [Candidatus Lokiarchaeia archaeon]|nr:ribonuclease PH [Candidatus Lokiarchaeia archaeon]
MVERIDGRNLDEMRPVKVTKNFIKMAEGSVLFETGETKVIVCVTVDEDVPNWMKNSGKGWVTAEYSMLPRSTLTRQNREREGRVNSRSIELSRLVGRALRPAIDMNVLGPRTMKIDCDVIQADGGTRCASITGAWIALKEAEKWMLDNHKIDQPVITCQVAAISVGIFNGEVLLDLKYEEDKDVEVDLNVIKVDAGDYIEIQGTAEHNPFTRDNLNKMLDMADKGLQELFEIQRSSL